MAIEFWYHSAYGLCAKAAFSPSSRASSNGSLPAGANAGTEPTVQCTNRPNLASSYHFGTACELKDAKFGSYM